VSAAASAGRPERPGGAAVPGPDRLAGVPTAAMVAERLAEVRGRIAQAGAVPEEVTVVAVTKGFGPAAVEAATTAGLWDVGENYAQELLAKAEVAPGGVRWHYLGELQRNKLARLVPVVHLWQALDSDDRAQALAQRAPAAPVLVEVKVADGAGRHGVGPEDVPELVDKAVGAGLQVRGLMAVGPTGPAASGARQCFRAVAQLAAKLGLAEVSMGMSGDYEIAVSEGATMVRLGRALFGPRPRVDSPGGGALKLRW
jgi:pyridoxal phosphate enzyme (YggS family)